MTTTRRILGAGLALTLLLGCSLIFEQPGIRVMGARVAAFGLTSGTAEILLEVDNPNGYGLEFRGAEYLVQVEDRQSSEGWQEFSRGALADTVSLPSGDTVRITLSVPFQYRALGAAVGSLMSEGRVGYQVRGKAVVRGPTGEIEVPFRDTGVIQP